MPHAHPVHHTAPRHGARRRHHHWRVDLCAAIRDCWCSAHAWRCVRGVDRVRVAHAVRCAHRSGTRVRVSTVGRRVRFSARSVLARHCLSVGLGNVLDDAHRHHRRHRDGVRALRVVLLPRWRYRDPAARRRRHRAALRGELSWRSLWQSRADHHHHREDRRGGHYHRGGFRDWSARRSHAAGCSTIGWQWVDRQ